jgi:hypothetical protein
MICKVDGCGRKARYQKALLCQKHYFRVRRNGTTETIRTRNYRSRNAAGYQLLYEPTHPLSGVNGYVYEHRMVYHDEITASPASCEICSSAINWKNLHIDHKDNDITNNKKENLRATCRPCNTFRGWSSAGMSKSPIELDGVSRSAQEWSRQDGVFVCGNTIIRRMASGMSAYDAIYGAKLTHPKSVPSKEGKIFDRLRAFELSQNKQ